MGSLNGSVSFNPLGRVTEEQLYILGHTLWSWSPCETCRVGQCRETEICPSHRSKRLGRFFNHYKEMTASYEPDLVPGEQPALSTHEELCEVIKLLISEPDVTRDQFAVKALDNRTGRKPAKPADKETAIDLAVKIMTTVNCSVKYQGLGLLEHGVLQIPWRSDVTFSDFMQAIFPLTDHPSFNDNDLKFQKEMKTAITAKNLKKRLGLRFQATDDLRRHLTLDRKHWVLDIYHNTAFLKEHLRLTKDKTSNMSMSETLKL